MGHLITPQAKAMKKNGFYFLLAIAVFLLPFTAVSGPTIFGEFKSEASFFIFLPFVFLFIPGLIQSILHLPKTFKFMITGMTIVFLAGFIANLYDIFTLEMLGRSGLNKLLSSLAVFYFCIAVMILVFLMARRDSSFYDHYFLKAVMISLIFVLAVSAIEFAGWYDEGFMQIYDKISELLRPFRHPEYSFNRLQSICFEPPFLAIFMGFCLVWLMAIGREATWRHHQIWLSILLVLSLGVFVLADSRTGYIFVIGIILAHYAVPIIMKRPNLLSLLSGSWAIFFLTVFLIVLGLLLAEHHTTLVDQIIGGESISNLSRYASNLAAFNIFTSHPIVGVGFGQYAFHARDTMPAWGWYSYEINDWFNDPESTWPPVFSLPARLGAETGLLGLGVWYGSIIAITQKLMRKMGQEQLQSGQYPARGHTLLLGMTYVLLSGIAYDSFRNFGVWIILGLTAAYIARENEQ